MFEGLWDHAKPSVPLPSRTDFNLEIPRHLEELYEVYLRELEEGSLERATIMDRVASRALQVGAWTSLNSLTWGSHEASQVPRVGFFLHHLSLSPFLPPSALPSLDEGLHPWALLPGLTLVPT